MSSKLEDFLQKIGNPGRYQCAVIVSMVLTYMTMIAINYGMTLITLTPNHSCKLPEEWQWPKNVSIPNEMTEKGIEFDKCLMYLDPENHSLGLQKCIYGYEYEFSGKEETITTEWNLVCDDQYLSRVYQSVYFGGVVVGGAVVGYFSDKYGRLPAICGTLLGHTIFVVSSYFVKSFFVVLVLTFLKGVFCQAIIAVTYVLLMELTASKYRSHVGVFISGSGSLALFFTAGLSQGIPNWRDYSIAVASPTLITLLTIWLIPESPRWLLLRKDIDKAATVCRKLAKFNGLAFPENGVDMLKTIAEDIEATKPVGGMRGIWMVLKNKDLKTYAIVLAVAQISGQIATYGNVFTLRSLGKDLYTNMYIMAAVDLAMRPITFFPVTMLGRRLSLIISLIVIGITSLLSAIFSTFGDQGYDALTYLAITSAMFGKAAIALFWSSIQLLINEIFPTTVRTSATGVLGAIGRLGPFILPAILFLGDHVWKYMPFVIYGALSIVAGLLSLMLPETNHRPMPDSINTCVEVAESDGSPSGNGKVQKMDVIARF